MENVDVVSSQEHEWLFQQEHEKNIVIQHPSCFEKKICQRKSQAFNCWLWTRGTYILRLNQ